METTINLISVTRTKDAYGVLRENESTRQVFADVTSVSQSEWFEGGRNGLNPELRFSIFFADYGNERSVEYEGGRYSVYRVYRNGDYVELYTERKSGA